MRCVVIASDFNALFLIGILILWLVWAASAIMGVIAVLGCFFKSAAVAGGRAARVAIALSAGILLWAGIAYYLGVYDHGAAVSGDYQELLLVIIFAGSPGLLAILCLPILNRRAAISTPTR